MGKSADPIGENFDATRDERLIQSIAELILLLGIRGLLTVVR